MLNKISRVSFGMRYRKGNNVCDFGSASYWGNNDLFINDSDSIILQKALRIITKANNVKPTKGDIIYATKSSDTPRFKLKEFIKENGLKKTSRAKMANVFIMNKGHFFETIKNLKYKEHLFINEDYAIVNHKKWFEGYNRDNSINDFKVAKDKNNFMLLEKNETNWKDAFKKYPQWESVISNNTHTTKGTSISLYREAKTINLLELIVDNVHDFISGDKRVIFDEDLFVELNKEGIELDDEYLQTLRDMLFSKDDSNIKLGFEMMSNLVINDHMLLTTSFLLNELIHTTKFRPSYYTNNNSNLKALLKVLKTKGIHWERDWKTFGTGLRNNFKTGKEGAVVKKFLLDNINREFKLNNSAAESLVDIVFTTEAQEIN